MPQYPVENQWLTLQLAPSLKTKFRDLGATVQVIKATSGVLYLVQIVNNQSVACFVQIFDAASGGAVTLGTTNPDMEFQVAGNQTNNYTAMGDSGTTFTSGIVIASTTLEKGSVGSAAGVQCFVLYR
jgi:hypothetical protein